jgi:hypothetical protein
MVLVWVSGSGMGAAAVFERGDAVDELSNERARAVLLCLYTVSRQEKKKGIVFLRYSNLSRSPAMNQFN